MLLRDADRERLRSDFVFESPLPAHFVLLPITPWLMQQQQPARPASLLEVGQASSC